MKFCELPQIPNYHIKHLIYQSDRTLVYRALKVDSKQPAIVKLMGQEYPSFNELVQFRNQYIMTRHLNIEGIVRAYALERYENRYAFIMEDFGGVSLAESEKFNVASCKSGSGNRDRILEFLDIAIQLAEILYKLHQNFIIHKDIKPANILVDPKTKKIKLIDFSISSLLPKETQIIQSPNLLEGTLAYLSPEQTGRMNRGIDYRSDFYCLGVTFYELLAGKLPFESKDPMELVYCHIAKTPPLIPPSLCPEPLAEIVMKLMAKNAEDRYKSALGLKCDLEKCKAQWQETGKIERVELGERDICDRFLIPEKLYGRETEVQTLLDAFDRVAAGTSEMILVAGFSGIGKTAVVNEVHKPIVRQHGYFIKGKFDQFNRNVPFSAFVQAFRDLVGQLLSESDRQLQQWKARILDALGENGRVIIDLIPELERIIGPQPPVPELSGTAAQNRFNLLFQRFIQIFTQPQHPLVMFVDDLQWADSASLHLLQLLMADAKSSYLLLLGAYRDNEVFDAHPLMLTLDAMGKAGATIQTLTLQPLTLTSVNHLIADTLHAPEKVVQPLTELVMQKTQGNPFFATQFLKVLHQERAIAFDCDAGHWQCDIAKVRDAALTDDAIEFMALQLQKLPDLTQKILKLAACIGAQFDLKTLAIVSQRSQTEVAISLWKALQEGLILPETEVYKFYISAEQFLDAEREISGEVAYRFLHDRVQQAAYSLILESDRAAIHLNIGRLLLSYTAESEREENLFAIVSQFNAGRSQIEDAIEREHLAELNLQAGQKAKAATAHSAALEYLTVGYALLPVTSWQTHYDLTLAFHKELTEVTYLTSHFKQMEKWVNTGLTYARCLLDKVEIYEVQIQALSARNQLKEALQLGLSTLEQLGVTFPAEIGPAEVGEAFGEMQTILAGKTTSELLELPVMNDPSSLAAMRLMLSLGAVVYLVAPAMFPLLILRQLRLSIQRGNTETSVYTYAWCGVLDGIERGYQLGELSLNLLHQLNAKPVKAKTYFTFYVFIYHWKSAIAQTLAPLLDGYRSGLETGDLEFASYCMAHRFVNGYFVGQQLDALAEQAERDRAAIAQIHQENAYNYSGMCHQAILNLLGHSNDPTSLSGTACDETQLLELFHQNGDISSSQNLYLNKLILLYLFGKFERALEFAALSEQCLPSVPGIVAIVIHHFYDALSKLAIYFDCDPKTQIVLMQQVEQNEAKLLEWATSAPMNYQQKFELVAAERYRILGNRVTAIEYYDRAIASAKENGFIQDEALANELAAKFYLNWNKEKVAAGYMQETYYCYSRWGATTKVAHLENHYPNLLRPILQQVEASVESLNALVTLSFPPVSGPSTTTQKSSRSTSINRTFDFAAILKASQALSRTIQLDRLLHQLTQIILQNSGSDRCALILPSETGEWQVRAIATLDDTQLYAEPLANNPNLPVKLIQYVKNTQEIVVIEDLKTDLPVIDEYLTQRHPKSLLCLPILNQGHPIGILYLKNRLTCGVFTSDRIEMLNLLCSQAAISLENARLYEQAQQALTNLQQAQLQLVQTEKMATLGNLVAGVAHEINNPLGFIAGNLSAAREHLQDLLHAIELYQQKDQNSDTDIERELENIDFNFISKDFSKLIKSMQSGCDRIRNISTSLRTFSRTDTEKKIDFNLHDGIESTLLILKYRFKANEKRPAIDIIKNYGNIPLLKCYPGQLNQVFMNILANAIDALEESNGDKTFAEIERQPNRIAIATELDERQTSIRVKISDNAKGMSEPVKSQIFDRGFTTKAVGKGTGLGMAIAQSIVVEKHGGSIQVKSQLGQGTEFIISLPR